MMTMTMMRKPNFILNFQNLFKLVWWHSKNSIRNIKSWKKIFQREFHILEQKYNAHYEPIFNKRTEIITGDYQPTPDDLPDDVKASFSLENDSKGIPDFWLTALQNIDPVSSVISARDCEALKYLRDIKTITREKEFELQFYFNENPYFTDKVLTKVYKLEEESDGEETFSKAEGCEINWKPGKNLTVQKKKKGKGKQKGKKALFKEVPCESFFNFFSPPEFNNEDEMENEEEAERIEMDLEIGFAIREKLVPLAVLCFTDEINPIDSLFEGDDYDQESDDDEDIDSESDTPHSPLTSKTKKNPNVPEQPPDCKQQ